MSVIPLHTIDDIDQANASGLTPVVFLPSLWLRPTAWTRWAQTFRAAGYAPVVPSTPLEPLTVTEVADHYDQVVGRLEKQPALVGHSFGALLAQLLAGRGLSVATVAIAGTPAPPTSGQFREALADTLGPEEAREFAAPESFVADSADTEIKVDTDNPYRGPILIISGDQDRTVPPAMAEDVYARHQRNTGLTESVTIPARGHALTIDQGWLEVCQTSLAFIQRFAER
ncbi:alpha/beta hydrolase [Actinoplanes sp. NPDC048796]|uniref:alpha/beta hydrolase n=1 Tax=unclassified Actinoplanes TaxID=2626549 RepID=UPI0033D693EB